VQFVLGGGPILSLSPGRLLVVYSVLALLPHGWAMFTYDRYWHSIAPLTTVLLVSLLVALGRRRKWSWWALLTFDLAVGVSFVINGGSSVAAAFLVVRLGLLFSRPVRRYVRIPAPPVVSP